MPEQTRADVEKSFEVLASRYGGKVLFMMNQGDFKEYWDKDAKGKCHGISILWLRHQHSELQSRAFAFFDEKKKRMVQLLEIRYRELKGRHDKLWARAQEYFAASQKDRFDKFSDEEQELFRLPAQYNDERDRRDHILAADPLARVLHEKMHREAQQRSGLVIKPKQERERLNDLFRQWDMPSIERCLDWAQNARLPNETQGNQLVLGYGAENGTIVRHWYRDGRPVLHIERKLDDDIETIDVTEGTIRFEVRERSE